MSFQTPGLRLELQDGVPVVRGRFRFKRIDENIHIDRPVLFVHIVEYLQI
jgi:hypothetical protein